MSARMLDGRTLSKEIRASLFERSLRIKNNGRAPGLAVILVGNDPASKIYVRNKSKACDECGVMSKVFLFPKTVSEHELVELIEELNASNEIDGILVQLPLPEHVNMRNIIGCISASKDVDGFHLYNVGGLVVGGTIFPPCTPYGVQLLLETAKIEVSGKNVVIVGASNIVGKPMALMLLQKGATVSICHIKTNDLSLYTRLADILIVAAGKPGLITADMVKNDVVVIDVGINRMPDGSITGDVDFDNVKHKASWITPVPGGVGPMTVTMLIENTIKAAELRMSINNLEVTKWSNKIRCKDYPNYLVKFDMPTVIIAGTENEVKECYEVYRQLRPALTRKSFTEQILRQMKSDNYKIACIKKDGKVVACAGFRILETLSWGKALYIDDLITDEMSRNRGHASHLITWLQEEAKRLSCKQLHLDSGFARINAHRFYQNSGFHIRSLHFSKEL